MDASFWNERYVSKEYVYGKEPNTFLTKQIVESVEDDMLWLFRKGEL